MTIGEDIVEWAKNRPHWQQQVLQTLAEGGNLSASDISKIADSLILKVTLKEVRKPLDLAMPGSDDSQVALSTLRECKGVNALVDDELLEFGKTGMTIIYGDNGSGKSGYARLVKQMVGARHVPEILSDVYEESPPVPSAVLAYTDADVLEEQKLADPPAAAVKKMSFYDEACGDVYLNAKSVLTYRPSALTLLDGLILVCDAVRDEITSRIRANELQALNLDLNPATGAGKFVTSLSATIASAAFEAAVAIDPNIESRRAEAATEVARLETSDSTKERTRLLQLAMAATGLRVHLESLGRELDASAIETARDELQAASTARAAAEASATADFGGELPGVGGETWRHLWTAARDYSVAVAYHDEEFPVVHESARCVLCHQSLGADAASRLRRFDAYMKDTTATNAQTAEQVVAQRRSRVSALVTNSQALSTQVTLLTSVHPVIAEATLGALDSAEASKTQFLARLDGGDNEPSPLSWRTLTDDLVGATSALQAAADAVDVAAYQEALHEARSKRSEIEDSVTLSSHADDVRAEV